MPRPHLPTLALSLSAAVTLLVLLARRRRGRASASPRAGLTAAQQRPLKDITDSAASAGRVGPFLP